MEYMNMNAVKPPMAFAVDCPRFLMDFRDGPDKLWMADVRARRHDHECVEFKDILFVESQGTAFIYGIEFSDGYPKALQEEFAKKQQAFIQFLREETRLKNDALGLMAKLFTGHEYTYEGKATAAYIVARDTQLMMGVGYHDDEGKYVREGIDPAGDGGFLEVARATVPFDELGA